MSGIRFGLPLDEQLRISKSYQLWRTLDVAQLILILIFIIFSIIEIKGNIEFAWSIIILAILFFTVLSVMRSFEKKGHSQSNFIWHISYPFLLMFIINHVFFPFINSSYSANFEEILQKIEKIIWGGYPVELLQNYVSNTITDVAFISYVAFFSLPLIFLIRQNSAENRQNLKHIFIVFVYVLQISLVFYYFFPVRGPESVSRYQFYRHLEGNIVTPFMMQIIDFLNPSGTSAFPSFESAIAITLLLLSFKRDKVIFFISLLLLPLFLFDLVYLRIHYSINILAGVVTGLLSYFLVGFFFGRHARILILKTQSSVSAKEPYVY